MHCILHGKGFGRGRGSHYTHTRLRSWTIPPREERRHVGGLARAARPLVVGRALLQDAGARRGAGQRRASGVERHPRKAGEAARRRRPPPDPARSVRIRRGRARARGAPRVARGRRGAVRGGRRGEAATGSTGRAAPGGPVAPVRGKGKAHEERAEGDREAQRRVSTPSAAPPSTSHVEFTRNRISTNPLMSASATVETSTSAARPSCKVTTAMRASDATLTPSRNAPATGERRSRGTSGPLAATNTKAGRKIPSVATSPPGRPPSRYPMNVAVVNNGPGVTWPTATASISCPSVSQPHRVTRSARRKARST